MKFSASASFILAFLLATVNNGVTNAKNAKEFQERRRKLLKKNSRARRQTQDTFTYPPPMESLEDIYKDVQQVKSLEDIYGDVPVMSKEGGHEVKSLEDIYGDVPVMDEEDGYGLKSLEDIYGDVPVMSKEDGHEVKSLEDIYGDVPVYEEYYEYEEGFNEDGMQVKSLEDIYDGEYTEYYPENSMTVDEEYVAGMEDAVPVSDKENMMKEYEYELELVEKEEEMELKEKMEKDLEYEEAVFAEKMEEKYGSLMGDINEEPSVVDLEPEW